MPTTHEEAQTIVEAAQVYLPPDKLFRLFDRLNVLVGQSTLNDSVKQTMHMLRNLAGEAVLQKLLKDEAPTVQDDAAAKEAEIDRYITRNGCACSDLGPCMHHSAKGPSTTPGCTCNALARGAPHLWYCSKNPANKVCTCGGCYGTECGHAGTCPKYEFSNKAGDE
jgi:hypothetical protein